ncbi:hypothetical protein DFH09DRAFT_1245688 [Mycena vulgaris]|nr:hypothetical protein DFH09DRAFT_1245688 [Mycena vulgaris]
MIMPRAAHTDIGASEHPGGMKTYCSAEGHYSADQGLLPDTFWRSVAFITGAGTNGMKYAQLTGCIRPAEFSQLNAGDAGGQYDSSGGAAGRGNPAGSACLGPRACIRCCDDPADCPTHADTEGCPSVIPGAYFDCD